MVKDYFHYYLEFDYFHHCLCQMTQNLPHIPHRYHYYLYYFHCCQVTQNLLPTLNHLNRELQIGLLHYLHFHCLDFQMGFLHYLYYQSQNNQMVFLQYRHSHSLDIQGYHRFGHSETLDYCLDWKNQFQNPNPPLALRFLPHHYHHHHPSQNHIQRLSFTFKLFHILYK